MPPKSDTAVVKKAVATAFQQARSKPVGFAYLIGKDGPVMEVDPRKKPEILWAQVRKQGGGSKGTYGMMSFAGGQLRLRCEESPPGALTKSFKDFLSSIGQSVRFDFLEPGAADPANENSAEASTEVAPDQADPNTTDPDEDEDTTSSEADLGELFQRARKRPMNTAWLIGKEGLVLRADLRKPIDVMSRQAMAAGAQPRGALGVLTVSGKVITVSCEEAPPGSFPQQAKKWLTALGHAFKVRIELPGGEVLESEEDDDSADAVAKAPSLEERLLRASIDLDAAKSVLDAKQHAGLAGLMKVAENMKETDPAKAIKALNVLEGRLANLDLPAAPIAAAKASAGAETDDPAPPQLDPVSRIIESVSPERKAAVDSFLKEFGEFENAWQLYDDEGGKYVSQALLGNNGKLGALTEAEQVYLAREAAGMWRHAGSTENIAEAISGVGDDASAKRALALGFSSYTADNERYFETGGAIMQSPDGAKAAYLMMQRAVDLDPAAVIEAFDGVEGRLGRIAAGVDGDWLSRQRQKGLLDVVGAGEVDPQKADLMTTAIYLGTTEQDMQNRTYPAALAKALGRVVGGDDPEAAGEKLAAIFAKSGAREMMFGDMITPELRNWALAQAANNPDFTAETLADGWESDVAAQAAAGPIVEKYAARGLAPFALRTSGPTGALHNSLGQALGIAPSNLPPQDETAEARAAREAAGLDHDYYADNARIQKISALIATQGGDPAQMTVLPIVVTSNEFGVASFSVFRLERPEGPRFVDDMGNKYDSVAKWLELNQLPPGKMTYPEALVLGAGLVTQNTPCVLDSLGEWIGVVGDGVALAAGITVGVIAIAGSGGLATPLVVAGAGAATWQVARAGDRMYDDQQRGKDLTDLSDPSVRGNWLEAGAGVLSVGAMGAAVRTARLVQSGAKVTQVAARTTAGLQIASDAADTMAMGDQAHMMANNWDRMSSGDKAMGLLNIAFWGGMGAASTKAGGALLQDGLGFTRLRNQAEFGTPYRVEQHPDLHDGQIRTAYDLDDAGRPANLRIETGGGAIDPAILALHANTGRQIEASTGLTARLAEMLGANPNPPAGSQGWEAKLEIEKIGAENAQIQQRLESRGTDLTPLEAEALFRRQQELADATDYQLARLQEAHAQGEGWIAAPSEGHQQAEGLGWPSGDKLPEGHHWVGNPNGEPT
ncbi:MAG: hypothetical protein ACJASV_001223, partial [Pseudorhodobacter sp.]